MLEAGKALKAAGRPFGWTLSDQSPADGIAASLVLLWAHGGKEFNADGTVALDSPETLAALDFAYRLQQEANDPAGTSYQEATNNQAFLAEQISMTYNVNTIYLPALENNPELAEAMDHALPPEGPGGVHNYTGVATMILLNHTQGADLDASKKFMLDFFTPDTYEDWVKLGRGYLIPAQPTYLERDVWDPDPKLAITRDAGQYGRVSGYELTSASDLSSIVQAQNVVTRMFSTAAANGDPRAALDAALAEIADLQEQL
jgi:multiple sugar transport system substrate-binding protein